MPNISEDDSREEFYSRTTDNGDDNRNLIVIGIGWHVQRKSPTLERGAALRNLTVSIVGGLI